MTQPQWRNKKTRIVATLGPASSDEATLRAMIEAGLNVVRINFSHGKHPDVAVLIERVRRIAGEMGVFVGILGDLRGPRIRVGEMTGGSIVLEEGREIVLTPQTVVGTHELISISYDKLSQDVDPGLTLLLDDGNLILEVVEERADKTVRCVVRRGGSLSSNRGVNLPGCRVSIPSLTEKDLADVDFMIAQGFDFAALSFVQSAKDVEELNAYLCARGADIGVIAKIEKKTALDDLPAILGVAYGVMVARGDLALEMSLREIPIAQKRIIAACRASATPVITATQMLESMIASPKPTRAEVTDVANAILDGTDAIMLSGESAMGKYPVEAVRFMSEVARRTEDGWISGELPRLPDLAQQWTVPSAVAMSNCEMAARIGAAAIVAYTSNGGSARWLMSHRPSVPFLALCSSESVGRRLALTWGAETQLVPQVSTPKELLHTAVGQVKARGLAKSGDLITVSGGRSWMELDQSNFVVVERLG